MSETGDEAVARGIELAQSVRSMFAGQGAEVQGMALADLLAIWLAGHILKDDPEATAKLRYELLDQHIKAVWDLIPVNEKIMSVEKRFS